jgi:hypothetical protein
MNKYKYSYKNFTVEWSVCERGEFHAYAMGHLSSHEKTLEKAKASIELEIEKFLSITPKTWEELATEIEKSLVWSSYEDCEVNVKTLKMLVENFMKAKN